MSLLTFVFREIGHRLGTFLLSVMAVAAAMGVVVACGLLLERDRSETSRLLAARSAEVEQRVTERQAEVERTGAELQDAIRKHMTKLGFNVLVLPEQQDLAELHLTGTLTETMPEEYVRRLADSGIVTVNHLLPMVMRRIEWPERMTEIILIGTRGEVPILHRSAKKPLLDAVAPGQVVVGFELGRRFALEPGATIPLLGREFQVAKVHPQRGTTDDVTLWIDLRQAQELLGLENLIHGILALECECAGDRISQVRAEIQDILPGTQVVERYSQALARAEARAQAEKTAREALAAEQAAGAALLQREKQSRAEIEAHRIELARWLAPTVIVAAAIWVGVLAFLNVRQRREEIGVLRAIGLGRVRVLAVFETRAMLVGVLGGIAGAAVGLAASRLSGNAASEPAEWSPALWRLLAAAPLAAVVLSAVAGWVPALLAANQDPAVILEGE